MARRLKRFFRNPKNTVRRRLKRQKSALQNRLTKSKKAEFKQFRREIKRRRQEEHEQLKTAIAKIENEIEDKKQEITRIGRELLATEDPAERLEHERRKQRIKQERSQLIAELRVAKESERAAKVSRKKRKKTIQQEIFWLERERRTAKEQRAASEELGTLPDFLIIGEKKCGTSFFYHLLTQHPYVEPAAKKELHYFDLLFDAESVEWYRRCFPQPSWREGRRTITGEATPYMSHPLAPQRIAKVVPQARLIALLRNPVDRAYSDYQMRARKGRENRTFEEAIGAAAAAQPPGDEGVAHADLAVARPGLLSKGVYVDHLMRWSEFFPRQRMLVLKSEDFFDSPQETLKRAFDFLGLPEWEPEVSKVGRKRNAGAYEEEMDPVLRRRLEEYFEPYNKRLYEFLGKDFGW